MPETRNSRLRHSGSTSPLWHAPPRVLIIELVALVVCLGLLNGPHQSRVMAAAPTTTPIVRCNPSPAGAPPGDPLVFDLYIENVTDLNAVDLELTFDATAAQIVDTNAPRPGVQIEPLSSFLQPDFVIYNEADNTAGLIQYAVTQVAQPAVDGSGPVARVTSADANPGLFTASFTKHELARPDGSIISSTAEDCTIGFWTSPDLSISKSGSNAVPQWSGVGAGVDHYELWRANNAPYFSSGDAGTTKVVDVAAAANPDNSQNYVYTDSTSGIGDTANNSVYVVRAVGTGGQTLDSNRVGEFDFSLAAGDTSADRYNHIALPLQTAPPLPDADALAAHVGSSVQQVLDWDAAAQQFDFWLPPFSIGENFALDTGGPYFLLVDDTSPGITTFLGGVPAQGSVSFNLEPGDSTSCAYNAISVPLDQPGITTASELANAIGPGTVEQVLRWDAPSDAFDFWLPDFSVGTNFAVRTGYPYFVCLKSTAPTVWP